MLLRVLLSLCMSVVAVVPVVAQPAHDFGWSKLTNRSGASVDFPGGLFTKELSTAPEKAMSFSTEDGRARFELFSSANRRQESPAQFVRRTRADQDRLHYKRITGNFIAASTVHKGRILYRRCNFSGAMIHCIDVRYPASEKRAWDNTVTRISLSLKPH
jgi:hypothetical protein